MVYTRTYRKVVLKVIETVRRVFIVYILQRQRQCGECVMHACVSVTGFSSGKMCARA